MNFVGKLVIDEDGALSLKMRLTPENPELYDIPLTELLEDFIGKDVTMDFLQLVPRWTQGFKEEEE